MQEKDAIILDGKATAAQIRLELAEKVKQRKIAISLLDSHLRGYSPREKWTNGLDQMVMLVDNPGHFLRLILDQRGEDIEDLVDLILDFEDGSHNDERYTDPARHLTRYWLA